MKIVLATHNEGKIREFKAHLQGYSIELLPQGSFQIKEVVEPHNTFVENALQKARHAARLTHLPVIADDSGLSVPALNGQPGIYSARYAGEKATDEDNIQKLLTMMARLTGKERQAYFYCVIVYLNHAEDATPLICEARWDGMIIEQRQGQQGFGYDPIFYVPHERKTAAEMSLVRKNEISHRGLALHSFVKRLPEKIKTCMHYQSDN